MIKKLSVLMIAFVLAACGSAAGPEKKGSAESDKNDTGDYAKVDITIQDDKVTAISMDETKNGKSKKELGANYDMKKVSKINKEWDEQISFLENYIKQNGLDAVELNAEGAPKNDDVLAGCTINIKNLMDTAKKATESAK